MKNYLVTHWKRNLDGDIYEKLYRFDDKDFEYVNAFVQGLKECENTDSVLVNEIV